MQEGARGSRPRAPWCALTVAPVILGGAGAPTLVDGAGFSQEALKRARLLSHESTSDGEVFLTYSFR
ncbi:MAG: hypothetical protein ACAI25_15040 [Planctomycetota bacterium]